MIPSAHSVSNGPAGRQVIASILFGCILVSHAFTVVPPPPPAKIVPLSNVAPEVTVAKSVSSSNLPNQQELLKLSGIDSAPISTINVAAATATTVPASTPASTKAAVPAAGIEITAINYDGQVPKTESDEYVVLTNNAKTPVDVSGYYIYVASTGTQGPTFTFPKDTTPLKPGQSVRIYTNEIHKETGGYSFGSGKALWNNRGGLAVIKDSKGVKVGEYKY